MAVKSETFTFFKNVGIAVALCFTLRGVKHGERVKSLKKLKIEEPLFTPQGVKKSEKLYMGQHHFYAPRCKNCEKYKMGYILYTTRYKEK